MSIPCLKNYKNINVYIDDCFKYLNTKVNQNKYQTLLSILSHINNKKLEALSQFKCVEANILVNFDFSMYKDKINEHFEISYDHYKQKNVLFLNKLLHMIGYHMNLTKKGYSIYKDTY